MRDKKWQALGAKCKPCNLQALLRQWYVTVQESGRADVGRPHSMQSGERTEHATYQEPKISHCLRELEEH